MVRAREQVGELLADERGNAVVAWALLAFLVAVAAESFLAGDVTWAGFVAAIVVLSAIPPVAYRSPWMMLPAEVVGLAALPTVGRLLANSPALNDVTTYLSVAALALVVAVELQAFTPVQMTFGFAVVFVVVTTLAAAGVWAVVRWAADVWLGTQFLFEPGLTEAAVEEAVMFEFVYSTVAGILGGLVFQLYFRRRSAVSARLPEGVDLT